MKITESRNMPPIDMVALGKMLGDDASLVQMILGKFRAEIAGDIAALGALAASGDPEPIRALAHRLKGTCSNAQAMPISNVAKLLQTATAAGDMSQAPGLINALQLERETLEQYLTDKGL
jgi:HPt (histidine-containing phosphotransfer) domain-containing protein